MAKRKRRMRYYVERRWRSMNRDPHEVAPPIYPPHLYKYGRSHPLPVEKIPKAEEPNVTPSEMIQERRLVRIFIDAIPIEMLRQEHRRRELTHQKWGARASPISLRPRTRSRPDKHTIRAMTWKSWPKVYFTLSKMNRGRMKRAIEEAPPLRSGQPDLGTLDRIINEALDFYFKRRRIRDSL